MLIFLSTLINAKDPLPPMTFKISLTGNLVRNKNQYHLSLVDTQADTPQTKILKTLVITFPITNLKLKYTQELKTKL